MSAPPLVSVVMPVYNGERFLELAIDSILRQTFRDFEFIIVNDGSTDRTAELLARYQQIDSRIRIFEQDNRGVTASLNLGCRLARGSHIARMDADDVSLPERLKKQVTYLEAHPEVGVLGTWGETIDENGAPTGAWRLFTSPGLIGWLLLFRTCLAHPSVMFRREVLEPLGFYNPAVLCAQDYELWTRAVFVTRLANIPDKLVQRRMWADSISSRNSATQARNAARVMHLLATRMLGSDVSPEVTTNLRYMSFAPSPVGLRQIELAANLVGRLCRVYLKTNPLSPAEAREVIQDAGRRVYNLAIAASRVSPWRSTRVFLQAVRLDPQLLSAQLIPKGMRAALRSAAVQ